MEITTTQGREPYNWGTASWGDAGVLPGQTGCRVNGLVPLSIYTGVSPLIILFIIPALGLHSNRIAYSRCFLVDGMRG